MDDYIKKITPKRLPFVPYMRKNWLSYAMIAPFMLIFFTFTVLPVISAILLSLTNFNMLQWPGFIGFSNFARMFVQDDVFYIALRNTVIIAIATGPFGYCLAILLAWLINELPRRLRLFMIICIYAPSLTGGMFQIWGIIFSADAYGIVNGTLMKLGFLTQPLRWFQDQKYVLTLIIIVQLWMSMGAGFLAIVAGLRNVDHELYEAAAIDGLRNRWQELYHITLPSIAPQMLFAAILQVGAAFAVSEVSIQLAGFPSTNYSGHTLLLHAYDYGMIRYEMGYSAAISVVLFAMIMLVNSGVRRAFSKISQD